MKTLMEDLEKFLQEGNFSRKQSEERLCMTVTGGTINGGGWSAET